jgi:Secretion system C-terminal sorting domain
MFINKPGSSRFSAYPNPAGERLFIEGLDENEPGMTIRVTDARGRLLKELAQGNLNGNSLDVSQLNAGTYFLEILADGRREVLLWVKG